MLAESISLTYKETVALPVCLNVTFLGINVTSLRLSCVLGKLQRLSQCAAGVSVTVVLLTNEQTSSGLRGASTARCS
jgi:hypothetical protein